MPYRIRALEEAVRRSQRDVVDMGAELANARKNTGATHKEVATVLGWSASKVRRIEHGHRQSVTHLELVSLASVVGLRYSGRLYLGTSHLRDAAQIQMLNEYRRYAASYGWSCSMEDPVPITGDVRAFDLMLRFSGARIGHEFLSRLRDAQAQVRPLLQKQRDAALDCLILVIKDTQENRRLVREAGAVLTDLFPLSTRAVLTAVRDRRVPVGNGIVYWRGAPQEPSASDSR